MSKTNQTTPSSEDGKAALANQLWKHPAAVAEPNLKEAFPEFIGRSPSMITALQRVYKAASTESSVLIYGESGTGKELVAAALHRLSPRSGKKFIPINCSAIPEDLLESELFGHEKGAFTGAHQRRHGYFEEAHGGTIFLDEIGDMPPKLQVKLLRVLQDKKFTPIGANQSRSADVRIIAATNINLQDAVKNQTFRLDLYYRLNVLPVNLPPLRQRHEDINSLIDHFLEQHNLSGTHCYLAEETRQILSTYSWPGNVRELQNLVERLVVMAGTGAILPRELPDEVLAGHMEALAPTGYKSHPIAFAIPRESLDIQPSGNGGQSLDGDNPVLPEEGINLTKIVEDLENNYILQALERTQNNKNQAARLLGINRTTLVERIKKRQIAPLNAPSREL